MGISDRLGIIRQALSGAPPSQDERLMQLYWNRAELKKELGRLQDQQRALFDQIKKQEAANAQLRQQFEELEIHLGQPEAAIHAIIYFQLRGLWRITSQKLARFAGQLRHQQDERERRRQLIEFDQQRRRRLAEFDKRLVAARARTQLHETQATALHDRLQTMRGFWNYFRRRRLREEIQAERGQADLAATEVTDLSDDRAQIEATPPPDYSGMSVDGRRVVNTTVIAYAQQLVVLLNQGGIALLAKETTGKRASEVRYGDAKECAQLMTLLRQLLATISSESDDLTGLKERTDSLRATATYRSDADTIALTDSIGTLPPPPTPVSGLETASRTGINVLVDDYWRLYETLLQ